MKKAKAAIRKLIELDKQVSGVICLACGTILVSWHRHDFKYCKCPNETFVDGGRDYLRYGGVGMEFIQTVEVAPLAPVVIPVKKKRKKK